MADKHAKWPSNIPGPFFVDDQCIACDACIMEAPSFFKMDDIEGHAYVFNQPNDPVQWKECLNALESCPVDAIGFDQEQKSK